MSERELSQIHEDIRAKVNEDSVCLKIEEALNWLHAMELKIQYTVPSLNSCNTILRSLKFYVGVVKSEVKNSKLPEDELRLFLAYFELIIIQKFVHYVNTVFLRFMESIEETLTYWDKLATYRGFVRQIASLIPYSSWLQRRLATTASQAYSNALTYRKFRLQLNWNIGHLTEWKWRLREVEVLRMGFECTELYNFVEPLLVNMHDDDSARVPNANSIEMLDMVEKVLDNYFQNLYQSLRSEATRYPIPGHFQRNKLKYGISLLGISALFGYSYVHQIDVSSKAKDLIRNGFGLWDSCVSTFSQPIFSTPSTSPSTTRGSITASARTSRAQLEQKNLETKIEDLFRAQNNYLSRFSLIAFSAGSFGFYFMTKTLKKFERTGEFKEALKALHRTLLKNDEERLSTADAGLLTYQIHQLKELCIARGYEIPLIEDIDLFIEKHHGTTRWLLLLDRLVKFYL